MKYTGSCHCKAVQFEFESPPITGALRCNAIAQFAFVKMR